MWTRWILVQQPDLAFRFVAESRYGNFHIGRATPPQVVPGEVRVVDVILHLEEPTASAGIWIEHRRFPAFTDGRRDPASIEREFHIIREIIGSEACKRPESARRRWAKQQQSTEFRWTPTNNEKSAIADLVSRRASSRC